ncbi:MAG TPA: ABC transporter permease [Methylomirabilota bacterium]
MATYIAQRLLAAIPVLVLTSVIVFLLMRLLPGDPVLMIVYQGGADVSTEAVQQMRRQFGLDQPLYRQYLAWVGKLLSGDLGRSIISRQPAWDMLAPRILPTAQIGLTAWVLAMLTSVPVGIAGATGQHTWKDWLGTIGSLIGAAMPYFLTGGLLIYVVAMRWRLLPASGYVSLLVDPLQSVKTTILPALTLALWLASTVTRQTRASFIDVLRHAYIRTARAKGLGEGGVILGHAFKNAMLPVVTILGIQLGALFSGAVITETIFAIPGVGRLMVDSILSRDYPIVQAVVLFITATVVLANLLVDVAYGVIDPRIRKT